MSSEVLCNPLLYMEIMKRKYPDTFAEWCCTELSHVLDFSGAENMGQVLLGHVDVRQGRHVTKKFSRKRRNTAGADSNHGIFGAPLDDAGFSYARQLIEHLKKVTNHRGIFRIPGNSGRQQKLKSRINSKAAINFDSEEFTTNDIACVLKSYLGDLPEPLLTERQYHAHIEAADLTLGLENNGSKTSPARTNLKKLRNSNHIKALKYLAFLLPPLNFKLLKELLELLKCVADDEAKSMMSAHNLGVIFAPHVLWPRYLTTEDLRDQTLVKKLNYAVEFMIKNFGQIFIAPSSLLERCENYVKLGGIVPDESPDRPLRHPPVRPADEVDSNHVAGSCRVSCPQGATVTTEQSSTKAALARLYADVQAMPEGPKKRRLMEQFAGSSFLPGTPTQVQDDLARRSNTTRPRRQRSKSVGETILKQVSTPFHYRKKRAAPPPPDDSGEAQQKFAVEKKLTTELRAAMTRPPRPKMRKSSDTENVFTSDLRGTSPSRMSNAALDQSNSIHSSTPKAHSLYTPKSSSRGSSKKAKSYGKLPVPVPRSTSSPTTDGSNPLRVSKRGNMVHPVPRPRKRLPADGGTPPAPMPRKAWTQTTPSLHTDMQESDV